MRTRAALIALVALGAALLTVRFFDAAILRILHSILGAELASAWQRYLRFAIVVVGVSGGVRPLDLEKYIAPNRPGATAPDDADVVFTLNVNDADVQAYLRDALDNGRLAGAAGLSTVGAVAGSTAARTMTRRVMVEDAYAGEDFGLIEGDRGCVITTPDGVDLVDAVAASCAGGFAYRIGDRHYIDGGYRINAENADLATGYDWVLVLSPLGGRSLLPEAWRVRLGYQVDDLSARGCAVDTVVPPPEDERFFGTNATDLTLRAPAARAGWKQGRALVDRFRSAT